MARVRDEAGVVFPSPVVMLSVIAVAMAGVAYVATQGQEPTEREVTAVSSAGDDTAKPAGKPVRRPEPIKPKRTEPVVERGKVYVEVYNNSGITGLASEVAAKASGVGWQVVGADNWYGTIPSSTVYYPARLKEAAKVLALDLGIARTMPAIDAMDLDRLTVVLTADAAG